MTGEKKLPKMVQCTQNKDYFIYNKYVEFEICPFLNSLAVFCINYISNGIVFNF